MTNHRGVAVIEAALQQILPSPGVYRMLDTEGNALYVGKARNLKRRVLAYTQIRRLPERLRRMVSETTAVETITTHTEAEALLLEANLIKRLKPRFNIVLRDDKSYPWLILTEDHPYPQIAKHRGQRAQNASYWGPFASAWAVNQTVTAMQRIFLIRSCSNSVFSSRTRPCLLFQIRRCSAPCVGRITAEDYAKLVGQAKSFLAGKASQVQQELAAEMEAAASNLAFERAAAVRDRLRGLTFVQGSSVINPTTVVDADVIAAWQTAGNTCVQVFFIRGGRNNGNREFYPSHAKGQPVANILSAFIAQFYDDKPPPPVVLINELPAEKDLVTEALTIKSGRKVDIIRPLRGEKYEVVRHAENNARDALERKLAEAAGQQQVLQGVAKLFNLPGPPDRIEVYDNSHIMGTNPYGVMVVSGPEGLMKHAYRKYQLRSRMAPGDDFAMMREMLQRRFARALKEQPPGEMVAGWPDLLIIDGGAGQLAAVREILDDLGIQDVKLVAIAKGPHRNAGREWLHVEGLEPFQLPPQDPILYYLQRLRDEAHRFAITTHRASRSKAIQQSELDLIDGVGPARKRALLNHFGSARGVKMAGFTDLEAAPGINHETARRVYAHFHPGTRLDGDT